MGSSGGVERREKSIRLTFTYQGKSCKETIKTDGEPLPPTPANLKYAARLIAEIREKIRFGTFVYSDYFPASKKATTGQGITVSEHLEAWIKLHPDLADSTIKAYRVAVNFWKATIGHQTVKGLRHSHILEALKTKPEWSGKTKNNKVSVLRQALDLAAKDDLIVKNPAEGLEASSHQKRPPDPFDLAEVDAIIKFLRSKHGDQIADYFEFKFFTGLRTGESLAIRWSQIDFNRRQMLVEETLTLGDVKASTKTSQSRIVELNSRAFAALTRMKAHTFMKPGDWVFRSPQTGERWGDDSAVRKRYWMPALKKLGIRYRSPYNTRHTYATIMLMSGVTPAYAAKQMGHSVIMFLGIYAKWVDSGLNALEMSKVESLLKPQNFPELSLKNGKT